MKKILKTMPWIIVGTIVFTTISLMDIVALLIALFIKVMRWIAIRILNAIAPKESFDEFEITDDKVNSMINMGYKYYIDLMYPEE